MKNIAISDLTLRYSHKDNSVKLPFRLNIELARQLDALNVDAIEIEPVGPANEGYYLIKGISAAVHKASVCVPVDILDPSSPARTWEAMREAVKPRLQVNAPVSTVQMEYISHLKPAGLLDAIKSSVSACAALCPDTEFVACDFTRCDREFLFLAIEAAIISGASVISLEDSAGDMLPDEFGTLVKEVKDRLPESVHLGIICSNALFLADACAVQATIAGADEIKTSFTGGYSASLKHIPQILSAVAPTKGFSCRIDMTSLRHTILRMRQSCSDAAGMFPVAISVPTDNNDFCLTAKDDCAAVLKAAAELGYEIEESDAGIVYDAFSHFAAQNGTVGKKELEAIVTSVAFQVPPTYNLDTFVITTGNLMSSSCHIKLRKGETELETICVGEGPVAAAFLAIEKAVGVHYELDDFQIRSLTEGREALGETFIKLRHSGKVYAGRGVSTDIVASSILAYINALNKIAYEEAE